MSELDRNNTTYQNLEDVVKAMLREKIKISNTYIRKKERS